MNLQEIVDTQLGLLQSIDADFELYDFSVGSDYASISYRLPKQSVEVADAARKVLPDSSVYSGFDGSEMFVHTSHYSSGYFD